MIIVEGPDGAGKTTLVDKLARRFSLGVEPKIVRSDMSHDVSKKAWCEQNVAQGFQAKLFARIGAHEARPPDYLAVDLGLEQEVGAGRVDVGTGSEPFSVEHGIPG